MNRFSRIRHHVSVEDVKKKHLENVAVEDFIKTEEEITKTISEKFKRNWRKELEEGMTTSNALSTVLPAEGEVAIDQVNPTDSASFADTNNMFGAGADNPALVDAQIRASGSGTGTNGFDVGGNYLAFQGGSTGSRMALLKPMDATKVDTLTITAIRGTGSNGGEHPDIVGTEELFVIYKTPDMTRSSYLSQDRNQNNIGAFPADAAIIAINQGDGTLQNYSITIPEYARQKNVIFGLFQLGHSGPGYDHYGVTDIKFQRRTPINVVVPLDSPEAISFVRVGTNEGDPKKRKKKINDQLAASDEYTSQQMGGEFPGQGARIDGEDPFKSAEVQDVAAPSPLGKPAVAKSFADFQKGPEKVEVLKTPEQIEALKTEYYSDLNNTIERGEYSYDDPLIAEIADKIIKLDPTSTDAYFYKEFYYYTIGDIESAKGVVDELINNNPDSPDGYTLRSYYKQEEGDLAGAIEDLEKSIELEPDKEYLAYLEMDLADLKFQEAEMESENAEKDRIESEAAAIQEKAHKDYWDNADLIEQEQPIEYQGDNTTAIDDLGSVFLLRGKLANLDGTSVGDRSKSYDENLAAYNQVLPQIRRKAVDYITNLDTNQFKPESDDYYVMTYKQQTMDSAEEFAKYYASSFSGNLLDGTDRVYKFYYDAGLRVYKSGFGIGSANPYRSQGGAYAISNIQSMTKDQIIYQFEILLRRHSGKYGLVNDTSGNSFNKNIRETTKRAMGDYLKELAKNLPDDYFDSTEIANPTTLYDQMKALYDEEDPEKEIKTELRANSDLQFEKQYKDLMTAWDSADKFSKFITPLKNLGDALLGSKTAQNAKYENYKIAIAKSIMLNKPIRVNPDTIDPLLIKKLGSRITPNQILSYDEEQRFKKTQETYAKLVKEGKGDPSLLYDYDQPLATDGIPLIPIVSEPVPYADENIYEDEFGRVFTNDGSVANTTLQPDRAYHGFASAYKAEIFGTNPLAGRGQAQYQIVVPPDGSEPYLLYKDHAYHNVKSADEGEVPGFMNKGAAGFVNWLGNTAHARSDGDANTGGMAGYPPNIRGDVITEFRIPITDLSKEVQESVYRHPLVTENPELVQLLRDKFYTDYTIKTFDFDEIDDPTGKKGKMVHGIYNNIILKQADKIKDFVTDNAIEIFLRGAGSLQNKLNIFQDYNLGDLRTNSNLLQRYDEYIQQTLYSPDGKVGYVPGFTTADGKILDQRIDVTDLFTKDNQNELKERLSDETIQKNVKEYLGYVKRKPENIEMYKENLQNQLNKAIARDTTSTFLGNSLGGGARVDVDEFLNGRLVIKKDFGFRHDENISNVGFGYERQTFGKNWLKNAYGTVDDKLKDNGKFRLADQMAKLFDVSNDAWAHYTGPGSLAISTLASVGTMLAARQLLHPVQGPEQSFRDAMEKAPYMPYKLQFDMSEKMMKIIQGIEDKSREEEDLGVSATDAATLAAERRRKRNRNRVNESNLFEKIKSKPFFNPKDIKPTFPENPPPEIDKKTGMHPNYGKQAGRYKRLDPISANAMPPTGDPEIDAVVDKQRTKPRPKTQTTFSRLKKLRKKS